MTADPPGIPAKIILRAMADLLAARADRLHTLADHHRRERRGGQARANRDEKSAGRKAAADHLMANAKRLQSRSAEGGPEIDAAVAGYLLAWAGGYDTGGREAAQELRDLDPKQYARAADALERARPDEWADGALGMLQAMA